MKLSNAVRGSLFFPRFLPSFSRLGYCGRRWVWPDKAVDFSGQRWLVTGASSGIGQAIARRAAEAGAEVIAVARNEARLAALSDECPGQLRALSIDLSNMAVVGSLADQIAGEADGIDVLVNNVGLMLNEREETAEGFEKSFATNLLGHYLLTEKLRISGALDAGMVINMSSGGMYNVALELDQLQGGSTYDGTFTYAYQKRAQVTLNRWWREQGLSSYVMHPGWVNTPGVETAMPEFYALTGPLLRSVDEGADTSIWLASARPSQPFSDGIWFDRAFRPAHFLPGTRTGASGDALADFLEAQLSTVAVDERRLG